jgi:hypothetical protein
MLKSAQRHCNISAYRLDGSQLHYLAQNSSEEDYNLIKAAKAVLEKIYIWRLGS